MREDFINFLNALMEAAPHVVEEKMTEDIKSYINAISTEEVKKTTLTENGKLILDYMQKSELTMLKSKHIAEGLFISSRAVSGALRKLVSDGFCEKIGTNPIIYALTEKGKNYKIDED